MADAKEDEEADQEALQNMQQTVPEEGAVGFQKGSDMTGQTLTSESTTYKFVKQLGKGSFGEVYEVCSTADNKIYAMKIEWRGDPNHFVPSLLKMELMLMLDLEKIGSQHTLYSIDSGRTDTFTWVVMDKVALVSKLLLKNSDVLIPYLKILQVGLSLSKLRRQRLGMVFSPSTAVRCGVQMLKGIEEVHSIGFLHRDIKPGNFCVGLGPKSTTVYLLDFGLARQWRDAEGNVRQPRPEIAFRGTPMYILYKLLSLSFKHLQKVSYRFSACYKLKFVFLHVIQLLWFM